MSKYVINAYNSVGSWVHADVADSESESRQKAAWWSHIRERWSARINSPSGARLAYYERGKEVKP